MKHIMEISDTAFKPTKNTAHTESYDKNRKYATHFLLEHPYDTISDTVFNFI